MAEWRWERTLNDTMAPCSVFIATLHTYREPYA